MKLLDLAQTRISGLKKKTAKEWAGPCPVCGGTDRFLIWTHREKWHCRGCDASGGTVAFLMRFEGMKCPEAHAYLGEACDSSTCPADKCPQREQGVSVRPRRHLQSPAALKNDWQPAEASSPREKWRGRAERLVEKAHAHLLDSPERLAYLAGRGLDRVAVEAFGLGLIPDDPAWNYAERSAWGLEAKYHDKGPRQGKAKKLWLPPGILIPYRDGEGVHRLRIRRWEGEPRYYWVDGSGDDVVVINPAARGFVVVESDLDGLLVAHLASDLVGAVPLGTVSAKPKVDATEILGRALAILVALDADEAGEKAYPWWPANFPRAERLLPQLGKDPGEDFQRGADIREWIVAALPPVFHLPAPIPSTDPPPADLRSEEPPREAPLQQDQPVLIERKDGRSLILVHTLGQFKRMVKQHPGVAVVGSSELEKIQESGLTEEILMIKEIFGAAVVKENRPYVGDPQENERVRAWWDERRKAFEARG